MGVRTTDLEAQTALMRDRVETGLDFIEQHGGQFLDRYGRTVLIAGAAVVVAVGLALVIARRRRHRPLLTRVQDALPDSVGARLERPIASLRHAAERIAH